MTIIKELNLIIDNSKISGEYWEKGIPAQMMTTEIELNKTMEKYGLFSKEDRKLICDEISNEVAWLLLSFATNMATYALRHLNQIIYNNGILALEIIFGILDQREILIILSLYYDISNRTNLSVSYDLIQNKDFECFIKKFLSRNQIDKSLESMGYILIKDENDNLTYCRKW